MCVPSIEMKEGLMNNQIIMKATTPYTQRESEYHKEKRHEQYWGYVVYTLLITGTLYFGLHIINYLLNYYV